MLATNFRIALIIGFALWAPATFAQETANPHEQSGETQDGAAAALQGGSASGSGTLGGTNSAPNLDTSIKSPSGSPQLIIVEPIPVKPRKGDNTPDGGDLSSCRCRQDPNSNLSPACRPDCCTGRSTDKHC